MIVISQCGRLVGRMMSRGGNACTMRRWSFRSLSSSLAVGDWQVAIGGNDLVKMSCKGRWIGSCVHMRRRRWLLWCEMCSIKMRSRLVGCYPATDIDSIELLCPQWRRRRPVFLFQKSNASNAFVRLVAECSRAFQTPTMQQLIELIEWIKIPAANKQNGCSIVGLGSLAPHMRAYSKRFFHLLSDFILVSLVGFFQLDFPVSNIGPQWFQRKLDWTDTHLRSRTHEMKLRVCVCVGCNIIGYLTHAHRPFELWSIRTIIICVQSDRKP